jgi:hypothetical protein
MTQVERRQRDAEAKRDLALRKGALPLERGTQEIVWNMDKVDVHAGRFDHQIGWVLIVAATKILELKTGSLFNSVDDLVDVHRLLSRIDSKADDFWAPDVTFTDYDFNRVLRKNLSSKNIEKIVAKLPTLIFRVDGKVRLKVVDDKGKEHWQEFPATNYDNIAGVEVIRTGEKKRGKGAGEERRGYRIYFKSRIGLTFWHNLASGGYSLITNKNDGVRRFLALPGSGQQLVWAIWQWKDNDPGIRSEEQLFRIMGWKRAKQGSNYLAQKKQLRQRLDRLIRDGFLQDWRVLDNGVYRLEKVSSKLRLKQSEN